MVHVGALGMDNILELARHAADQRVDGLSAVPPFFHRTDLHGLHDYYETIAEATELPLLCYNVPGLTSAEICCEDVSTFLDIPKVAGIKYSGHSLFDLANILELEGGRMNVLSGNDEVFLAALAMGAHGSVGLNHNHVPRSLVRLYRNFREGNWETAKQEQCQINRIVRQMFRLGAIPVMKHIMKRKGMDCGLTRSPIRVLTEEERRALNAEIDDTEILWED